MKGSFTGWSSIDVVAMIALLAVMTVFARYCLPRLGRSHEFFSIRRALAFLAFSLCAGCAWLKLESPISMETGFAFSEAITTIHLAQDRLTGGFVVLAAMSSVHAVLWFSQRRNIVSHK